MYRALWRHILLGAPANVLHCATHRLPDARLAEPARLILLWQRRESAAMNGHTQEVLSLGFCWAAPGDAVRCRGGIHEIIIHRIAVSQEDPAYADEVDQTLGFFATHPVGRAATGGAMPYPLLVDPRGGVWQTQRLLAVTPHAARYNSSSLGVAAIGDFRGLPPTVGQMRALIALLAHLLEALGADEAQLHGHDGLTGASRQPDKICPGQHLPIPALRVAVAARRRAGPTWLELAW